MPLERLAATLNKEHAAFVDNHRTYTDERRFRELSYHWLAYLSPFIC
jgi:hypothetical protein